MKFWKYLYTWSKLALNLTIYLYKPFNAGKFFVAQNSFAAPSQLHSFFWDQSIHVRMYVGKLFQSLLDMLPIYCTGSTVSVYPSLLWSSLETSEELLPKLQASLWGLYGTSLLGFSVLLQTQKDVWV